MSIRMEKINSQIKKIITEIVQRELDDPHCTFISITSVSTTKDLREAKVYFSTLKDNEIEHAEKSLNKMSGFIRKMLGKKVRLRILPALTFLPDTSIKYSVEINRKIEEVIGLEENNRSNQE